MGNTCVGLNFLDNGEEAKEQQRPFSIQHKPPEQIKIPEPEKQEQESVKPTKIKKVTGARLCTDSVLQRKTGNLKDFFTLGEKLGQGKFGEVFICIDKGSGELYACKSIAKTKLLTDDDVEDVRREIQIMHHLVEHPNVISIKGEYEDDIAIHVVMELCAGGDLYNRITTYGHYTERKAAELTRVIIGVVEACHSLGVMHRDLKPENFLFVDGRENALVKTIDFGLSVFFKPGELFHDAVGSPNYVAPEVLKQSYGPEVDVWSAGVIVYILLSGVPPFWAETKQGIFEQVLHGDLDFSFDPWPNIYDGAKDLVRRMLVRDPKNRLTAHEVLCHHWVKVDNWALDKPLDYASCVMQFLAMDKLKKMVNLLNVKPKIPINTHSEADPRIFAIVGT
ncbi:calcium-dependent protein kinase 1-like [Bidens hawaiensis]|uniref:calcium-dependent protein kinase 1-like n=1 Tax=Bidens hawaiensis TaxID=980011 RepID=UPI00404B8D35